jgi:hypothetical protein
MRVLLFLQKISKAQLRSFALKRLPIIVVGTITLLVFGVKGLVTMTFMALAFVLGWTLKGAVQAYKDYRLSQALNRVHFNQMDVQTLRRERDLALAAVKAYQESTTGRGGPMRSPATMGAAPDRRRMSEDDKRQILASLESEVDYQ